MRLSWLWLGLVAGHLAAAPMLVYVGCRPSVPHGIYVLRFEPRDGTLSTPVPVADAQNPSFLALDASRKHLYVSGELSFDPPVNPAMGGVAAYAADPVSGSLTFLNQRATGGAATTHVAVDPTGRCVVAVNFDGGYICALPLSVDGRLGPVHSWIEDHGANGPNRTRQTQPHPHGVSFSPDDRFVYCCDLGLDKIFSYRFDPAEADLVPNDPPFSSAPPGTGPHHGALSRDGRFFYTVNELGNSICVFAVEGDGGIMTTAQTVSTLDAGFQGPNTAAEIALSPDQRFLYASNRGADTIAVFARNSESGHLIRIQSARCGGRMPRSFALSRDGRWLICANLKSDDLVVFQIDLASGHLTPTGGRASVKKPFAVVFAD